MGKPTELPPTAGEPSGSAQAFFPPLLLPPTADTAGAEGAADAGIDMAMDNVPDFFGI